MAPLDVPQVMASPLQTAVMACWPWGDAEYGARLRTDWLKALDDALADSGTTGAVVPLHVLAEKDGVLERYEARGLDVDGAP